MPTHEITHEIVSHESQLTLVERALHHGTVIQRAQELETIYGWLGENWDAPNEVRIAVRRTIWRYEREARYALLVLGGLAAAW